MIDSDNIDIPMLDDEVTNVEINGKEVNNSNIVIVNDLYELVHIEGIERPMIIIQNAK